MMLALALAAAVCPIDRALYRLRGARRYEAGFARLPHPDMASDLRVFLKTPRRTYWFAFIAPNGLSGASLTPAASPHPPDDASDPHPGPESLSGRGIDFDTFAADLSAVGVAPQSEAAAPAHLFSRALRTALWYDADGLAGGDHGAKGEIMPIGFFDRAGCAPRPH